MIRTIHLNRTSIVLAVATLLVTLAGCAGGKAEQELAALQENLEGSDLSDIEKAEEFTPQFEAFAVKYWGREPALTAKLWLLEQTWWEREQGTMNASAGLITDDILNGYPRSDQLVKLGEYAFVYSVEQKEEYFSWLLENSPHRSVKAAAIYALAAMGERTEDVGLKERRMELLQQLIDDYADIERKYSTYGEVADAALYMYDPSDLEIGRPAPDILGRTFDGQPLRLSDFIGKVVVLDFWGDW